MAETVTDLLRDALTGGLEAKSSYLVPTAFAVTPTAVRTTKPIQEISITSHRVDWESSLRSQRAEILRGASTFHCCVPRDFN